MRKLRIMRFYVIQWLDGWVAHRRPLEGTRLGDWICDYYDYLLIGEYVDED